MKVISVHQPWAALMFAGRPGWKNIENRTWSTRHRGWIYIHATRHRMTETERKHAWQIVKAAQLFLPSDFPLRYGGIIGMVKLIDCVRQHKSPWFEGPWGWVLGNPYPLPFEPCAGQQGLWDYGTLPKFKK